MAIRRSDGEPKSDDRDEADVSLRTDLVFHPNLTNP